MSSELLRILKIAQSFYASSELEVAIRAAEKESPDAHPLARKALKSFVWDVLFNEHAQELRAELVTLAKRVTEFGAILQEFRANASQEEICTCLFKGALKARYDEDAPGPKREVAEYVAAKFFPEKEKCFVFVQASITAIHLGQCLAKRRLGAGSLFHTNSIVFPILVLEEHPEVSVYAFSGTEYDNFCGGWLPRHVDKEAQEHLDSLFNRTIDPLKDSYVTPMTVSANGRLHFTRSELVPVIETLCEHSAEMVIMTFTGRIHETEEQMRSSEVSRHHELRAVGHNHGWTMQSGHPARLVVSRDPNDLRGKEKMSAIRQSLREAGLDVHWQEKDGKWDTFPAIPACADRNRHS
ncbi:MAG: hypothetical protein ACYC6Y_00495 [Thermoguttaceae bacterium]